MIVDSDLSNGWYVTTKGIYIYIYIYIRVFPTGGNGGKVLPPPPAKNLLIPPHLEKFPHSRLTPPPKTTKQQFSSYNPIKTAFLAVVNALAPFLF